jgi:hypothetical protein
MSTDKFECLRHDMDTDNSRMCSRGGLNYVLEILTIIDILQSQ